MSGVPTMQPAEIDRLASYLAAGRRAERLSKLPMDLIHSRDEAEAVQNAALEFYDSDFSGYAVVGSSEISRRSLGLGAPFFAPMANSSCFPEGSRIHLPEGVIGAQCELALTVGRVAFNAAKPDDEIEVEILACQPAISILGHRARQTSDTELSAIADFGLHVVTVLGHGPAAKGFDARALDRTEMVARINGKPVTSATGAAVMGHPLHVVAWLARELKRRYRQLNTGDIVTVGSFGPILQVLPGQELSAEFGSLGKVSCVFD